MTRQEYEAKLADLQSQIEELKQTEIEEDSPKPPHSKPKIRLHQEYYYVAPYGGIIYTKYDGSRTEKMMRDIGNVFLAEEAAEYAVEYFKVLSEMREWAGEWNDPWGMLYNGCQVEAISVGGKDVTYGELRFATKEDTQNCIKSVGEDRIKKYYFGITE